MPVFNRLNFLKPAIESVIQQTHSNWELVLVDDGSESIVIEYLQSIQDERVRLIMRDRQPKGAPTCRNIGWQNAESDFILFLDSDDLLAPWALKERLEFKKSKPGYSLYIFEGLEFDNDNPDYHRLRTRHKALDPLYESLNFRSCLQTSCVFWNKSTLTKIGGWNEDMLTWQDGEIHIRFFLTGMSYIWGSNIPDVFIRKHNNAVRISSRNKSIDKYINLFYSYISVERLLEGKKYKNMFVDNYNNLLFTFVEGMKGDMFYYYKQWVKKMFSKSTFRLKLLAYIDLYYYMHRSNFLLRIAYQLRKFGIPNFRKPFWTDHPKMTNKQIEILQEKIRKHDNIYLDDISFFGNIFTFKC